MWPRPCLAPLPSAAKALQERALPRSPLAAPGPGHPSRPCGGPVTAGSPPSILRPLRPREGGDSTTCVPGRGEGSHACRVWALRGRSGAAQDKAETPVLGMCWWRHPAGPTHGQHRLEAGAGDRGPRGAGVPGGGEWRSTPVAEEERRLLWLVDSAWAGAHLPVLPMRVMLRVPGRRGAEAGPLQAGKSDSPPGRPPFQGSPFSLGSFFFFFF